MVTWHRYCALMVDGVIPRPPVEFCSCSKLWRAGPDFSHGVSESVILSKFVRGCKSLGSVRILALELDPRSTKMAE